MYVCTYTGLPAPLVLAQVEFFEGFLMLRKFSASTRQRKKYQQKE
jgi:hypothetical protein